MSKPEFEPQALQFYALAPYHCTTETQIPTRNQTYLSLSCMYVYLGLRARQHLRSLAPVMKWWWMIFGDLVGPKLPDIRLTGKTPKNLTQETCPDRGSNPGPLRDKRACYHLFYSGGPYLSYFKPGLLECNACIHKSKERNPTRGYLVGFTNIYIYIRLNSFKWQFCTLVDRIIIW